MPNTLQDNQTAPTRRRVFEDFSVAQIIASVLSTLTSALLSSKIGLIGGLVGAAIGAAVAAAAYQIFRGLLNASADKIREVAPDLVDAANPYTPSAAAHCNAPSTTVEIAQAGGRVAPSYYRQMQAEQACKRRLAVIGTSIAAILAVAITAFAIDALSAGQGIGARLTLMPTIQNKQATTSDASSNKPATNSKTSNTTTNTDTASTSTDENTQSNSNSTQDNTSNNTSDNSKTDASSSTNNTTDTANNSAEDTANSGDSSSSRNASNTDSTSKNSAKTDTASAGA